MTLIKPFDSRVICLSSRKSILEEIFAKNTVEIYSEEAIRFLHKLAEQILADSGCRQFPDVISFALWCRSIEKNEVREENSRRVGRGLVFHITPGNVPINFAYSLVAGLLSGNVNIVRLPTREFVQTEYLIHQINLLLENSEHSSVSTRILMVRYSKEKSITDEISQLCDVRVIWGGNASINEIRLSHIPAKSSEITFSDRFSFCVINSVSYLNSEDKMKIAQGFYNDTYLFDQNACTAPHLIVWIGSNKNSKRASRVFWEALEELTSRRYSIEPLQIMDKLVASAKFSASNPSAKLFKSSDNKIFRFELSSFVSNIEEFKSHSGLFYELNLEELGSLSRFPSPNFQTMTYFGFDSIELNAFINDYNLMGIDRLVPIGKSLEFSLVWDGHDLIRELSRKITISV